MARTDTRRFRTQSAVRAQSRAGAASAAESWRALAHLTVASTLVVAVVVSALALVEAVLSSSTSTLARYAGDPSRSPNRHAHVHAPDEFSTAPAQVQPALFVD
jgi:hypothetical protein